MLPSISIRRLLASTLSLFLLAAACGHAADFAVGIVTNGPRSTGYIPRSIRLIDGAIYFSGVDTPAGTEPRVTSDASSTGAILLGDLVPGTSSSDPDGFCKAGALIYFAARDGTNGTELWATDGTPQNTRLVKNIAAGPTSSNPANFIECQGKILFTANDGIHGRELWVSDGTSDGTKLVKDIDQYDDDSSNIGYMFNWNGIVYFAAEDGTLNEEVWRTDGTPNGTYLLKDLNDYSSDPSGFTVYKNELYFQANASANIGIAQLWKTNGTSSGTVLVKNIPGSTSGVEQLTVVGDKLFFAAPERYHDFELWCSNGTSAGTYMVKNINAQYGSSPHDLVSYHGALYFVADDGTPNGDQMWKSDGTDAGTVMVFPTFNGESKPRPQPDNLVVLGGTLLFQQSRDGFGRRWFQSDGSSSAFQLVTPDAITAVDDSESFLIYGNSLIFNGLANGYGSELFIYSPKLTVTAPPTSQLAATGTSASFTVATSFTDGVTYQWQHDGHDLPGANAATYTIAAAALTDGGTYHAVVSNGTTPVTSGDATLGVVERTVANATAPEAGKFVFKVNTTGAGLTYKWKHAGADIPAASRITGITAATLQISAATPDDAGSYTCDVSLGNQTVTSLAATATIITKPVVSNTAPPPSIVTGPWRWQLGASQSPTSFTVTGLPLGLSFDPATQVVSGTPRAPGSFTVKVTARNAAGASAVQSFTVIVGNLPDGVAGTFTGLLGRDGHLDKELGGSIRSTVSRAGVVSVQAVFGLVVYTVHGTLSAPLQGNPTAALLATHPGLPSIALNVTCDGPGQAISGTATGAGGSTSLFARLLVWNARTNPATSFAGSYNCSLALPQNLVGNLAYPQGNGWLQLKVATSGIVTVFGQTPDGAPVSCSATLWPDGAFPVVKVLYGGHGSLLGTGQITLGGGAPGYLANRVTGSSLTLEKIGPAATTDHNYAAGIPLVALTSDGSKWLAPAAGTNVLGVADAVDNTQVAFSQAGIQNVAQYQNVNQTFELPVSGLGKFTALRNPCGVKATFYPATGRFIGSLALTDPNPAGGLPLKRTVAFNGLVLQHRAFAVGLFLLPSLPAAQTTPTVQSGLVKVTAQ